jgi:hypothetical protein
MSPLGLNAAKGKSMSLVGGFARITLLIVALWIVVWLATNIPTYIILIFALIIIIIYILVKPSKTRHR